jgi:K+-sensing histidine kinase KdpD
MGLGLAISHTIIEAHGGRLWAKNNPEAGATFCFTVPVAGNVEERGTRGEWGVEGRVSVSRGSGKSEE